jgi:DNA-binding transcriptional LysR family regulator
MMDLVALHSLIALEVHGSVAAAAAAQGYTPSAVSQQIKRLERDLGVDLLERVGRGVVRTEAGRTLVAHGHGVVRHLEAALSGLEPDGVPRGPVRIAAFSSGIRGLVAPLLADLATGAPQVTASLIERDPAEAVDLLTAGQADLALVHAWVGVGLERPATLAGELLGYDHADLLVHRDHPLAGRGSVSPPDLLDQPWASNGIGTICHHWFLHMFAGYQPPPRVRFWCWEFQSQVRLVEEGVAVALVPRLGRGPLPATVVAVPVVDPEPTRVIEILWRESMDASPALHHVRGRLRARFHA